MHRIASAFLISSASLWVACSSSSPAGSAPTDAGTTPDVYANPPPGDDAGVDAGTDAGCTQDSTVACGTLSWARSPSASRPRNHHVTAAASTASGTFLYAIGGFSGSSAYSNVDRVAIRADGSLGSWTADTALPLALGGSTGEVVSGVMVIAGGQAASGSDTDLAYAATIQPDGSLGSWRSAGSTGNKRLHPGSFAAGNVVYVMGGFDVQTVWNDVVSATVQADGSLSAWGKAGILPDTLSHFATTFVDGYVYLTGGLDKSAFDNPPELTAVWRGQVQADGSLGAWTAMTALPVAEATHASFLYGGYLYIAGRINATALENRAWRAPLQADHSLGSWTEVASLPIARGHVHQLPVVGSNVYSVSGAIDFSLNSTTEIDIGTIQ